MELCERSHTLKQSGMFVEECTLKYKICLFQLASIRLTRKYHDVNLMV